MLRCLSADRAAQAGPHSIEHILKRQHVAKSELGTKRICPETGRKFYDLNKDPIVSPYTGQSYPRRFFDTSVASIVEDEEEEKEVDLEETSADLVSLEEADDEAKGTTDDLALDDDEDDVDLGDDEDDTFLADDEEDEDDVSGIISVGDDDDEN
jgi:uncharacterized protein (TIGR02300 family)